MIIKNPQRIVTQWFSQLNLVDLLRRAPCFALMNLVMNESIIVQGGREGRKKNNAFSP
jgi:hypothetical protein